MSLNCGTFTTSFNRTNVVPVYKNGETRSVRCDRLVSVLQLFSNIVEKVVCDSLCAHVSNTTFRTANMYLSSVEASNYLACYLNAISESIGNKK